MFNILLSQWPFHSYSFDIRLRVCFSYYWAISKIFYRHLFFGRVYYNSGLQTPSSRPRNREPEPKHFDCQNVWHGIEDMKVCADARDKTRKWKNRNDGMRIHVNYNWMKKKQQTNKKQIEKGNELKPVIQNPIHAYNIYDAFFFLFLFHDFIDLVTA